MKKLYCFAVLCLIFTVSHATGEESENIEGSEPLLKPLIRERRQDEVDIITRGRDGRVINEIDIITNRRNRNDNILRGRTDTSRRRGTEIDILRGSGRSGVREIDIVRGGRRPGVTEIDILRGGRRSGTRETDILSSRRTGTREVVIDRRRTDRIPTSRGGVEEVIEEGIEGIDIDKYKPMPYKFKYTAPNHKSIVEREEEGDATGVVRGHYAIQMGNGLYRYVEYIADKHGFRAAIRSNEPGLGVGAQGPPADTTFEIEQPPKDLKEVDLPPSRAETDSLRTTTTTTTRTDSRRGSSGARLIPISEAERDRRERVIIEEEIIEEPRRTVVIEEDEPETVVIEERRTARRDGPRVITRN